MPRQELSVEVIKEIQQERGSECIVVHLILERSVEVMKETPQLHVSERIVEHSVEGMKETPQLQV